MIRGRGENQAVTNTISLNLRATDGLGAGGEDGENKAVSREWDEESRRREM